jgi:hypothetical protein
MELKDMILSTLAELEEINVVSEEKIEGQVQSETEVRVAEPLIKEEPLVKEEPVCKDVIAVQEEDSCENVLSDERYFCESMRERILVLFEGFQSPINKSIEATVDLTLNFLEYLLAVVDDRLENLDKKEK